MNHDQTLQDIDAEYAAASTDAFRLGRRLRSTVLPVEDGQPSLLARLQHPQLRRAADLEPPDAD